MFVRPAVFADPCDWLYPPLSLNYQTTAQQPWMNEIIINNQIIVCVASLHVCVCVLEGEVWMFWAGLQHPWPLNFVLSLDAAQFCKPNFTWVKPLVFIPVLDVGEGLFSYTEEPTTVTVSQRAADAGAALLSNSSRVGIISTHLL